MNFLARIKNVTPPLLLVSLLGVAIVAQIKYDSIKHPRVLFTTETRYILPSSIVTNFSFGFRNILADLYWIKVIQDFSIWDGKDPFYLLEYKNIAALDPKFSYPYLLGILTFTTKSVQEINADTSILETIEPIIEDGIKNLPDNWEIPFYLGTGFQLTHNTEKALKYLKLASSYENAPERIHNAYKSYLKNTLTGKTAAGKDTSRDLIQAIYETTENGTTKKMIEESVRLSDLTDILEGIVKEHKKKYGYYPSSIFELAAHKMLKNEVLLNKQFRIIINQNTGKVTTTLRKK